MRSNKSDLLSQKTHHKFPKLLQPAILCSARGCFTPTPPNMAMNCQGQIRNGNNRANRAVFRLSKVAAYWV
jgi:hypothetical protein